MSNEPLAKSNWQVKTGLQCLALFLLWLLMWAPVQSAGLDRIVIGGTDGQDPLDTTSGCSVVLALSGGGARGLSTIGILRAFEEKHIHVRSIAGTSMGGIVGGLYAAGYSPEELASIAAEINFNSIFSNAPSRRTMFLTQRQERDRHLLSVRFDGFRPVIPKALSVGQELTNILTELTTKASYHSHADFGRLPIPFLAVSTDIVSGEEVILGSGPMADAMSATMAFPLALAGVETAERILMDGGMVTPVPVKLASRMCDSIDLVVAVNTASKLLPKDELTTPLHIASQVTTIMTADQLREQLASADYVIEPPIDEYSSVDFDYLDSLLERGYRVGLAAADSILRISRERQHKTVYRIESLLIEADRTGLDSLLTAQLGGSTVTRKDLVSRLKHLCNKHGIFRLEAVPVAAAQDSTAVTPIELRLKVRSCFGYDRALFRFEGNTIFDDSTLAAQLLYSKEAITPGELNRGLDRIINLYVVNGFDMVDVSSVDIDHETTTITVTIDEAVIEGIDVENNRRTKEWFVRSYFSLKSGEPYSTSRASGGIANIYGTDLFDRVTVGVVPSTTGARVKLHVDEKAYHQLRLGWHWHDTYESEEFAEFLDDNVGGMGLQYLFGARYGPDRQDYYGSFKADRILSSYVTARIAAYHRRLNRQLYVGEDTEVGIREENRTGAEFTLGQQIRRLGTLSAGVTVDEMEYEHSEDGRVEEFSLRILHFQSLVEDFDRIPFPESGRKHLFRLDFAGKYLGGDVEFTKFFTSIEGYFRIGNYLNYHPRIAIGVSRSGLPPSEQFFIGGSDSFAGLKTHQLSGDKMVLFNHELRVSLPLHLYLTARYDLGEVYAKSDQIKLRNIRHGVGAFIALDSPIGPVEFGYGVANSDINHSYLNIGLKF